MQKKYRIGFLDEDSYEEFHNLLTKGILDAARIHHFDIIRFSHFLSNDTTTNQYHEQTYLELIRQFKLDGIIFLGWDRTVYNNKFFDSMKGMPLVSVGVYYSNIPSVYFPGRRYVAEIMRHLINDHGMKKIAYIAPRRPDDRSDLFFEVMNSYGIYDPRLYISAEEMYHLERSKRGRRAVEILLDERKILPEAIVSLYNDETFELINALQERGIRVPDDIAVTSYEDGETGRFAIPAFTTVYFPWKELGYHACDIMNTLLTKGEAPLQTVVPGRVILRSSCGCISQSVMSMEQWDISRSTEKFGELDRARLEEIADGIAGSTPFDADEMRGLIHSFRQAFAKGEYHSFLMDFEMKLRKVRFFDEYNQFEQIAAIFKKSLMPYLLTYKDESMDVLIWADNMFHQMQVILQNRLANAWFRRDVEYNKLKLALKEAGKILITNFSVESLLNTLEEHLPQLHINSCWLYLFGECEDDSLFADYRLEFQFRNGKRLSVGGPDCTNASPFPSETGFDDDISHMLLVHLLYQGDQFMGFCVFETDLKDFRIIRNLSSLVSIALNSAILFEKLDRSYRKLMEKAHKKGMSDTTGILHDIANIMNSINTTYQVLLGIIEDNCINDFVKANKMLESKLEQLDEFILDDPKGELLMQYYVSFKSSFKLLQNRIKEYVARMIDKTGLIEDIINTQQSFEGIRSNLELMDVIPVIEDALKVSKNLIEINNINVVKKYDKSVKAMIQKTKLLNILINIVKNAVESMQDPKIDEKILTVEVTGDAESVCIRISDTGRGLEEGSLEEIFAYGYTTKSNGHGFGLHSCANYMMEMKGRIWAEKAAEGDGAVFVMQFRSQPFV